MKGEPSHTVSMAYPAREGLKDCAMVLETFVNPAAGVLSSSGTMLIKKD